MKTTIDIETKEVGDWIEWLARFGKTKNGGVTRLLYDENWRLAQHSLFQKMKENGLNPYFDGVGNLFGRLAGVDQEEKAILTGSHIDTVIDGGKYDGAFGIMASFIAVNYLKQHYGKPKKTIEVVSLCEEEGSRFPLAFWGSGSVTGKFTKSDCEGLADARNISFAHAMTSAGLQPVEKQVKREDIECFIEIHIEQGAVLEKEQKSIGIVSHIVGQRRFTIKVTGESNHAGTTPMPYRKDSIHLAAELITYAIKQVTEMDAHLVATVGKIQAVPNIPNVIAKEVTFTLDVRHHQEEVLDYYCEKIFAHFKERCKTAGMEVGWNQWLDVKAVAMDDKLTQLSERIVEEIDIPYQKMISGAGHDAQIFGTYCPTALLFVPSVNGISHSPKEHTNLEDLKNGVVVLIELLHRLAY
ncbi:MULTISPECIES: allantoate deiminase [Niallia]|jgi:allantoate deiminase|uniref:Allantoate amidohydrolase n=1 Tax=Niallia circulans TaxID=1397 RepID=A0AA91TS14_NIACI|nr:allantoate deiminase [Niallia circulans]NRG26387.1 allantoate deiminase [Niallia circulans]PAD83143.1 allantoate amidohydrolase [Niallia circulans]QJX63730.1 allantoate deiminase [Niallia circulans]